VKDHLLFLLLTKSDAPGHCPLVGGLLPGQRAEIRERIASESLQKIHTKLYEVAGHACRVETIVTNHLDVSKSYTQVSRTQHSSQDELTDTNS